MNLFAKRNSKLIKGCKANERSAQEGLYKLFYAEMLRLCYRYLKSDELAKEAMNAGFLKVFQHIDTYEESKGTMGAWISTIMVRTCLDLARKEIKFNNAALINETEDIFLQPDILNKLYAEDLLKCIRLLPAASQVVFNLSVIEGYSHKEIGGQLNITESTSRWHLSEAKKQLRAMLTSTNKSINQATENKKST